MLNHPSGYYLNDSKADFATTSKEPRQLRIALYHPWVYLKSGLERSLLEIIQRSRHQYTLFTSHYDRVGTYPELAECDVRELEPRISVERSYGKVADGAYNILRLKLPMDDYDGLVVSSEGIGDFVNFRNHRKPIISFCHTPLKIIHDPYARDVYLNSHPEARWKYTIGSTIFKFVDNLAWHYYAGAICNSEETRQRVLRAKLATEDKLHVLHPGVDLSRLTPSWEYRPYFLLPGRIMWQKNIELGIRAFQQFEKLLASGNATKPVFRLIIAGMVDEKSKPYYAELRQLVNNNPNIQFCLNPGDTEMHDLYRESYGVLFTARNEDWGIVPLEGMAFGKPVISVNRGGPTESIIHRETGFLLEPDPEVFAATMFELAQDPQLPLKIGRAGRERARLFDWEGFVNRFDDLVEAYVQKPVASRSKSRIGAGHV